MHREGAGDVDPHTHAWLLTPVSLQSSAALTKGSRITWPGAWVMLAYPGNWFPSTKPYGIVLDFIKQGEVQACPFKDVTQKWFSITSALILSAWMLSKGGRSLQGKLRNIFSLWRALSPAPQRTLLSREGHGCGRSTAVLTSLHSDRSWPAHAPNFEILGAVFKHPEETFTMEYQESREKDGGGF